MNTNGRMMTVKRDGLPYEEMGYCPPPNRKLPPVPGQHSNYNTIDRIKNGKNFRPECSGWVGPVFPLHQCIPYKLTRCAVLSNELGQALEALC